MTKDIKPARELETEGLRGVAALLVMYTHFLAPAPHFHVDPGYAASPLFWRFDASQGAVLLFFMLSGYVIGLTNQRDFSTRAVANYGWRRALRIVPLYWAAIALSFLVRPDDSLRTVGGNLLFLQNFLPYGSVSVPVLSSNHNLWSLNYEVLYYVLFPLVWMTQRHWFLWLGSAGLLGIVGWQIPGLGAVVASYAAGWAFWLCGYGLAQSPKIPRPARLPWPSFVLLGFATWHLKPLWFVARRFELLPEGQSAWMNYSFYDFILPCVALLMVSSGRRPRHYRLIVWASLLLPFAFVLWRLLKGRVLADENAMDDGFVLGALLLWWWRPRADVWGRLAWIGSISYGLYIFHRPAQWFIRDVTWLPQGTAASFAGRLIIIVLLSVIIAWSGERVLQPWLKARLARRKLVPVTP